MSTETNTPADVTAGAPLDFAEYEAWHNAGRNEAKESKPAAAEAKADATKTNTTESETEPATEEKDNPQKKSGFQRRIDRLNQKLGASAARIAELESAQGGNATATKTEAKPAAAAETAPGKPEAKNFDTYEEYIEAISDWKLDAREKTRETERAQREANAAHDAVIAAHDAVFKERKALYPDWKEKVEAATDIPITQIMHTLITESEYRADLGYFLADNPDEAKRIAALTPLRQAAELGKLETTFADAPEKKTAEPVKRVSKAPAPIKTLRAQAESGEPDPADFAAWERWRNKQPGASFRR